MPLIPLQELYEQFNRLIDKPHEYNRLLSSLIAQLNDQLAGQTIVWDNGTPYIFDPLRQKYLSLTRTVITSAFYGNSIDDRYLRLDGVSMMGSQGFLVPRDGTITGLWAKSRSNGAWNIEVRKNGIPITLVNVTINSGSGYDNSVDIDIAQGDWLQLYLDGNAVQHPIAACELSWRLIV